MLTELLAALEAAGAVEALRQSRWTYPVVNTGHILGLALLFGAIVPLDLRMVGLWRAVDPASLERVLVPVAAVGLGLALPTGFMLFAVRASEYAAMPLFQAKVAIVTLAVLNAGLALTRRRAGRRVTPAAAIVSMGLWGGAITAGRFVAYVD